MFKQIVLVLTVAFSLPFTAFGAVVGFVWASCLKGLYATDKFLDWLSE